MENQVITDHKANYSSLGFNTNNSSRNVHGVRQNDQKLDVNPSKKIVVIRMVVVANHNNPTHVLADLDAVLRQKISALYQ